MAAWLLNRLFETRDQPTPRFALQSTLNWMRGLAILVSDREFTSAELTDRYAKVSLRCKNLNADTRVFECLLMAMHNISALNRLKCSEQPYDVVRAAIVAWYYTVYESSSAMTLAASGVTAEQHAKTARIWQSDIVGRGLAPGPFGLSLNTLVTSDVKKRVDELRGGSTFRIVNTPTSYDEAWGATCAYLSGTADYEKRKVESRIRDGRDFKNLNVDSFRGKAARELRDTNLEGKYVNFLIQSFRYRGKANYRDSIYLSYGVNRTEAVAQCLADLFVVGGAFLRMASHYASRRVNRDCWQRFVEDLNANRRIEIIPGLLPEPSRQVESAV